MFPLVMVAVMGAFLVAVTTAAPFDVAKFTPAPAPVFNIDSIIAAPPQHTHRRFGFDVAASYAAAASLPHSADYTYSSAARKFYKQHRCPASWDRARGICHKEGAELAYPDTPQEREALRVMQRGLTGDGVPADMWLGIYDSYSWRNVYNETVKIGELNYEPRIGIYLAANGSRSVADFSAELPFVCEISRAAVCDPSTPGYALGPDGRSCYKLHRIWHQNWTEALLTCDAEGAQLAVINSQQEADYLVAVLAIMAAYHPPKYIAIGVAKLFAGHAFFTVDGHPLASSGYEKWASGEPNNTDENENCVSMYPNGLMNDISCSEKAPFICEKKVPVLAVSA